MRAIKQPVLAVSILLLTTGLAACSTAPAANPGTTPPAAPSTPTAQTAAKAHWGYEGKEGPEHWGALSPEYALCSTGKAQTPIDLAPAKTEDAPDVEFSYQGVPLKVLNNGHTVQVPTEGAGDITVAGRTYSLAQFHFHTPSEHTVDGATLAGELHLVHQHADKSLAVVGVLLKEGAENAAFTAITGNLPAEADQTNAPAGVTVDPLTLLPTERTTFQYTGSLTTPPCSEGVSWFVMTTPVELSSDQLSALEKVMGHNNRPVQPVNERELVQDTVAG